MGSVLAGSFFQKTIVYCPPYGLCQFLLGELSIKNDPAWIRICHVQEAFSGSLVKLKISLFNPVRVSAVSSPFQTYGGI
jgi:hypothetical protein